MPTMRQTPPIQSDVEADLYGQPYEFYAVLVPPLRLTSSRHRLICPKTTRPRPTNVTRTPHPSCGTASVGGDGSALDGVATPWAAPELSSWMATQLPIDAQYAGSNGWRS